MKFTLKDYQEEAVKQVLERLARARRRWQQDGEASSFALSATTGAGKTVMAAAVFEALFYGNDEFDFAPDPGAVVIWFSDDPSLNTQSMWRLHEASDKLNVSQLVVIENSFNRDRLEAGKIYFLNTQKLGRNSLLVRGHDPEATADGQARLMPDDRAFTIWDIIQNTIATPGLTLYLLLDEAHRGMREAKGGADGKPTIVRQLINGSGAGTGIPVVWGISATVDRFTKAMEGAKGRTKLPDVQVDAAKVQASGLLKDAIILDVPDEKGNFATVLLRRATGKLREITTAWADYARAQGSSQPVLPLMVLQVPNAPDHNEIGEWLDVVFEAMPELPQDCVANVFGEHRTERFGRYDVPYVEPQRVQDSLGVRVLIAKDAISTGWDCPRAEVMVSLRPASDDTYITQLLGRMVRTPLARRIPGNDRLNAVDCILPRFDRETVQEVVRKLQTGEDSGEPLPERRILLNPVEVTPNPAVPEEAWHKLLSLPSQCPPRKHARPVRQLTLLGHELAADGFMEEGGRKAHEALHGFLDRLRDDAKTDIERLRQSVLEVEGKSLRASLTGQAMSFDDFVEAADLNVIEEAYRAAGRIISPDVCRSYAEHIAASLAIADEHEALVQAHEIVAALGLVPVLREKIDAEAQRLANAWLLAHAEKIDALNDERKDEYRDIREMSAAPLDTRIVRPRSWMQPTTERQPSGKETPLERPGMHLLSDDKGGFPVAYGSGWEKHVITTELKRAGLIGWYRNPGRSGPDSLGIGYVDGEDARIMRPDFLFFVKEADGSIAADLVDPHDHSKADALPKLRGLARYAEKNGTHFRRIEAIAEVDGAFRALDVTNPAVRAAIDTAPSAKAAYLSPAATLYGP